MSEPLVHNLVGSWLCQRLADDMDYLDPWLFVGGYLIEGAKANA